MISKNLSTHPIGEEDLACKRSEDNQIELDTFDGKSTTTRIAGGMM